MTCTYNGCTASGASTVWIDNLGWHSVSLDLCPEHSRALLDALSPFMRPDDWRDIRLSEKMEEEERGASEAITGLPLPPPEPAKDGDFFLDTDTGTIYGPRANGAWPAEEAEETAP